MKALVLEEYNLFVYKDVPEPVLGTNDVLVRDMACGICGEFTIKGSCTSRGEYPACLDMIAAGTVDVDALITAVAPLAEGDR